MKQEGGRTAEWERRHFRDGAHQIHIMACSRLRGALEPHKTFDSPPPHIYAKVELSIDQLAQSQKDLLSQVLGLKTHTAMPGISPFAVGFIVSGSLVARLALNLMCNGG